MKISTIVRDTYKGKIYFLMFSFLLPMLIVYFEKYNQSKFEKIFLVIINIYLWGSMLRWATKAVFINYLKKWDNGQEINQSMKKTIVTNLITIINGVGYFLCIYNSVSFNIWLAFSAFYVLTSLFRSAFVISNSYLVYGNKIIIIENIKAYQTKKDNVLSIMCLDNYKYEIRIKEEDINKINLKLNGFQNNESLMLNKNMYSSYLLILSKMLPFIIAIVLKTTTIMFNDVPMDNTVYIIMSLFIWILIISIINKTFLKYYLVGFDQRQFAINSKLDSGILPKLLAVMAAILNTVQFTLAKNNIVIITLVLIMLILMDAVTEVKIRIYFQDVKDNSEEEVNRKFKDDSVKQGI